MQSTIKIIKLIIRIYACGHIPTESVGILPLLIPPASINVSGQQYSDSNVGLKRIRTPSPCLSNLIVRGTLLR